MAEHKVSRRVVVDAPPERIFDILASPYRHPEFDGSGAVRERVTGPDRLTQGDRFGMHMKLAGATYRTGNRVVEFEENRRLAWRHAGPHRWRWTLEPWGDGATLVTETFDYSGVLSPAYVLMGWPARNARAIEQTLPRLKRLAEDDNRP